MNAKLAAAVVGGTFAAASLGTSFVTAYFIKKTVDAYAEEYDHELSPFEKVRMVSF